MEYYDILIKGHLDDFRLAQFEGLTAERLPTGETRLRGALADQAALHGILNRIRDLGLPLLQVNRLGDDTGKDTDEQH